MSNHLREKFAKGIGGGNRRLVSLFGKDYWTNVSDKEIDLLWHTTCIYVKGITTLEELHDLVA